MTRTLGRCLGLSLLLLTTATATVQAQGYPGGYGRYGWGGWGSGYASDPAQQYMQGLGYYLKNEGEYKIDQQKANALEIKNIVNWNKALREAQRQKRIEEGKREAIDQVIRDENRRVALIENGELLNELLDRVIGFPAAETKKALAGQPLSATELQGIAFENDTDALTLCLDELTRQEAWPNLLKGDEFASAREKLAVAVDAALKEDVSGTVSESTQNKLDAALEEFHKTLTDKVAFFSPEKSDAESYLVRLGAMIKMLESPNSRPVVRLLETYKEGNLYDLVAFMHTFNLKFAPAKSDREKTIYKDLYQRLSSIPSSYSDSKVGDESSLTAATSALATASESVFKDLEWSDLDQIGQPEAKNEK